MIPRGCWNSHGSNARDIPEQILSSDFITWIVRYGTCAPSDCV